MIFEKAGMFSTFHKDTASDPLAHTLANALVGNTLDTATLEMTFVAPVIHFDEPTLIALTGADFKAYTKDKPVAPYKLHLMERGDTLMFRTPDKGTRAYMAVGGGMQLKINKTLNASIDGLTGLIKDGDVIELSRQYTDVQKTLLYQLVHQKESSWGIDRYSLARIYYSDVFHIAETDYTVQLTADQKQLLAEEVYEVSQQFDRTGFMLDGDHIAHEIAVAEQPICRGAVQLSPEGRLIVIQNDVERPGKFPQIATIAPYHLPKLSQKKPGSKLIFKWETLEEHALSEKSYETWVKSLLLQINYHLKHQ
ncbi:allophanate hydrolase subunit 2 family protein [Macrococcus equipercicus]|uniref:Allophanate hydrolase subunit 2 family protein n=1 Tax=Macrococcus equipercicus TaxID=69967 RepID=A0A9Q9F2E5_9STAP|nr:allophanate hydrolase subunit 2 family protein [Macrococcus equipercicus]KAA1042420.1 allophanate hydrolase subunit 2 family protein [Macrococcus equipercicus]UTH14306.1 allophanate hydrolase subunit 2 family protein [Macrococcus equipercicus]